MSLSFLKNWLACTAAVGLLGWGDASAQTSSVFDLEWDGPETSTVEECYGGDNFCYDFPVIGSIEVGLGPNTPYLTNIDSDILLPPQTPNSLPAISPSLWFNFDLLEGEYLPNSNEGEVSMVFRPAEIGGVLRAFEIFVDITDDGQSLELTGGIEQSATSPLEPNVRLSISGQLTTSESPTEDLVDGSDFLALQRAFGATSALPTVDMTGDRVVTAADFARWQAEYGSVRGSSAIASIQAVPEPGTLTLAACFAFAELTMCLRRRQQS